MYHTMMSLRNAFERLMSSTITSANDDAEEKAPVPPLLLLPPEIILLVADELSTSSTACFALSSRRLSCILGTGFGKSLQREATDIRLAFLASLARDLPQHFACQRCVRLHRISAVKWPRIIPYVYMDSTRCCTWRSKCYSPLPGSRYKIYFPQIQLAMKQHYCGTDIGFPLDAFQHLEVIYDETEQRTTLSSVDAQIVSDELLIRAQTWILLPWNRRDEFLNELTKHPYLFAICLHSRRGYLDLLPELVRSTFSGLQTERDWHTETLQCDYCCLDYALDAIDLGDRGVAVLTTRWVNMGAGLDLADLKWKSHISTAQNRGVHGPRHPGDIRAKFEGQAKSPLEERTADNEVKLFSKRKARLVYRGSDGLVWKWDRYKRWYLAPSGPPDQTLWEFITKPPFY